MQQGNIIIIVTAISLIALSLLAFRKKKVGIGILLLFIVIATILIPNLTFIIAPVTQPVQVRVVDAVTKKPLPNINVKIAWYIEHGSAGGRSIAAYRELSAVTDDKGEFIITRVIKPLSFSVLPLYLRRYGGIRIVAYDYDYEAAIIREYELDRKLIRDEFAERLEIPMKTFKDDKAYLKNIENLAYELSIMNRSSIGRKKLTIDEKNFIVDASRLFDQKYPKSNLGEENYFQLGSLFNWMEDYEGIIKIFEKMIRKYPSGKRKDFAMEQIDYLKKYKIGEENGKK